MPAITYQGDPTYGPVVYELTRTQLRMRQGGGSDGSEVVVSLDMLDPRYDQTWYFTRSSRIKWWAPTVALTSLMAIMWLHYAEIPFRWLLTGILLAPAAFALFVYYRPPLYWHRHGLVRFHGEGDGASVVIRGRADDADRFEGFVHELSKAIQEHRGMGDLGDVGWWNSNVMPHRAPN